MVAGRPSQVSPSEGVPVGVGVAAPPVAVGVGVGVGVLVGVGVGVLIAVPDGVGVAVWRDSAKFQGLAVEVKTVIWTSSPLVVREETQGSGEAMSDPGQSGTSTPFLKMATEVLTPSDESSRNTILSG